MLFVLFCTNTVKAPGISTISVNSTTLTTISLSWSVASGTVDSYEVLWETDTTRECPDGDEGNVTITNGSTSYTIMKLKKGNRYNITVTATNVAGSTTSSIVTAMTVEAGEGLVIWYE